MTRITFGILAFSVGLLVASGTGHGQTKVQLPSTTVPRDDVDPKMPRFLSCAKACDDCARACDLCSARCARLLAEGKKEHLATLRLCEDCSAICSAAARVVAKDGPLSAVICVSCAEACKICGDACAKHAGDAIMKACADECRKCEKACREMAKAHPAKK